MIKKISAILLALFMICAAAVSVHAAGYKITIEVDDVNAGCEPGAVVKVPVRLTENTGYISALFNVKWDPSALELTGVEYTELAPDQGNQPLDQVGNTGTYTMRVGNSLQVDNFEGTGLFFTLLFKVTASAKDGDYVIAIEDPDVLDTDLNQMDAAAVTGTVRLSSAKAGGEGDMPTQAQQSGGSSSQSGNKTETQGPADAPTSADATVDKAAESGTTGATGASVETVGAQSSSPDLTVLWIILACVGAAVITVTVVLVVRSRSKKND